MSGAVRLAVEGRSWLLPPAFAAWIPAGTPIAFDMPHPVTSCSILFDPAFVRDAQLSIPDREIVFTMDPLAREMVLHARRWGPDTVSFDKTAATFFRAMLAIVAELAQTPANVWRTQTTDPALARAVSYTEENFARDLTIGEVAGVCGMSKRTLLRRYTTELGMTWVQSLKRIRMIEAMERLATTDEAVTTIALDVGYHSLSAFNAAFRAFAGKTPSNVRSCNSLTDGR